MIADIYDDEYMEELLLEDGANSAEQAFMLGYNGS